MMLMVGIASMSINANFWWEGKHLRMGDSSGKILYIGYLCNKEGFKEEMMSHIVFKKKDLLFMKGWINLWHKKIDFVISQFFVYNHELHLPMHKHMLKSNRSVCECRKVMTEINSEVGMSLRMSYETMKLVCGAKYNVGLLRMI